MRIFCFLLFVSFAVHGIASCPPDDAKAVLRKMYERYHSKWQRNFSFTQETGFYRNDSLKKTETWYEHIVYPNDFRITIGDPANGNAMIQSKDSAHSFRKGKLVRRSAKGEDLTFLLGGMFFVPFDSVPVRVSREGYDVQKLSEAEFKGRKCFIVGADSVTEKTNQLWIDAEWLIVTRFVRYENNNNVEAVFGDHVNNNGIRTETSCNFFVNDKLIQTEKYSNLQFDKPIDMRWFDTVNFYSGGN